MQIRRVLIIIAVFAFSTAISYAASNDYSLWLRAQPQAIVADSFTTTTITAEVRDSSGDSVPDGTQVDFTSSLGIIEHSARTASGVARVSLQSDTTVGTAVVSAVVSSGRAVAQLSVDFVAPGTELFDESFISVSSNQHLGYDVSSKTVDSAGGVTIYHRGLTIIAEEAQIDVKNNILRARARLGGESILIKRGNNTIPASALYYNLSRMNGVILTPAEDGAKRMLFRGRDMFVQPDDEPDNKVSFDLEPIAESNMFIRARSLLIRPGEEIKIKRANFYLEGDKVLSVPLHVVSLNGQGAGINQMVTYGTEGLSMDLPIYYSLTPTGTGSVRLRHSEPAGWGYYSGRAGWQVDLEQEYNLSSSTEGKFTVNRLTSGDWGIRWNHRREFDNDSRLRTYLDFPSHEDLYGTMDYSRSFGNYTMSLRLRGNKKKDADGTYSTSANIQSRAKPLLGNEAVSYAFTTRLSYDDSIAAQEGSKLGTSLGFQFYGKPLSLWRGTLSTSLSALHDWGGEYPGSSIYANAGYYRNLGTIGSLGLNYTYSFADSEYGYNAQRISTDFSLRPSKLWSSRVYLTYGLNDGSTSAFGDFGYSILPTWRLSVLGTYQSLSGCDYTDAEFALSKAFGRQEGRIIWSQSRKRFRVEFSTLSF